MPKRARKPQNAGHLLDQLIKRYMLKNDAALCRMLDLSPPQISKIRHGVLPVTGNVLVAILHGTDLTLAQLDEWLYFDVDMQAEDAPA
jgi:plasmid maintenance system antidote protein VapI